MNKFAISVIDFIPQTGKFSIGEKDSTGQELCVGDIVEKASEKYMIAYRYGSFVLKPAMSICYILIKDYSEITKLNEVWSTPDLLIVGFQSEPFYEKVRSLCEELDGLKITEFSKETEKNG